MKIFFSLFITVCFTFNLPAQNSEDSINAKINLYHSKAGQYLYKSQDSAFYYLDKIIEEAKKTDTGTETILYSLSAKTKSAGYFFDLKEMKSNIMKLDSLMRTEKKSLSLSPNYQYFKNSNNTDKGLYYYRTNDYSKSRDAFNSIINEINKSSISSLSKEEIELLYSSYIYVAKMYTNDGKYNIAKEYYTKSIKLLELKDSKNFKNINRTYSLLAEVLKEEREHEKSNQYFTKSLNYNLNNNGDFNSIVTITEQIIQNHIALKQLDSANYYLKIIKDNLLDNHPRASIYYEAKAEINKTKKEYIPAITALEKALLLVKQKWNNQPHNDVAEIYNKIGDLYAEFSNPNIAIVNYDLAIKQFENDTLNSTINQTTLFKSLKLKANILNQVTQYDTAINTSEKALTILDQLKPTFKDNNDKLFLIDNAFPVFESGLDALYKLYKSTSDNSLIDKAFIYTEKSKSTLLLEALLNVKATDYANIPSEIIEKEKQLKSKITEFEKRINRRKTDALEDELFNTKTQYRTLISDLETNYKNYFNLKYNSDVISIENVQEQLKKDELLISYFYGNKAIYAIAISKDRKQFISRPIDANFKDDIIEFQKTLSNPKSNIDLLSKQSFAIYSQLLQSFLKDTQIKNLIIIPDGLLNYIPFSSLNTSENNTKYLIEDYAVSYVNSATLRSQLQEQQENNSEILAFAPTFTNENNQLLPLPNNKKEVEAILTHVNGKSFTDNEASLENFNGTSKNYNIIHLATHAIFDDNNPEYSFLAFAPKTESENLLYIKDLYNLKLNANLVTLSACESGIGDLKRGEGLMSLARGFYFSGAKSIASTLWKINDASSSKLMDDFYLQLSKNDNKNTALQKAQVNFINNNRENALSHPYYWSGFVISGNTKALNNSSNYWLLITSIILMIIGLASIYLYTKKVN